MTSTKRASPVREEMLPWGRRRTRSLRRAFPSSSRGSGRSATERRGRVSWCFFLVLAGLLVMLIPGVAVWLFGVYDAWAIARRMNAGTVPFRKARLSTIVIFMVVWTVGVLALLTLAALAAFAAFTVGM